MIFLESHQLRLNGNKKTPPEQEDVYQETINSIIKSNVKLGVITNPKKVLIRLLEDYCQKKLEKNNYATLEKSSVFVFAYDLLDKLKNTVNYFSIIEVTRKLNENIDAIPANNPLAQLLAGFFSIYQQYHHRLSVRVIAKYKIYVVWDIKVFEYVDTVMKETESSDKSLRIKAWQTLTELPKFIRESKKNAIVARLLKTNNAINVGCKEINEAILRLKNQIRSLFPKEITDPRLKKLFTDIKETIAVKKYKKPDEFCYERSKELEKYLFDLKSKDSQVIANACKEINNYSEISYTNILANGVVNGLLHRIMDANLNVRIDAQIALRKFIHCMSPNQKAIALCKLKFNIENSRSTQVIHDARILFFDIYNAYRSDANYCILLSWGFNSKYLPNELIEKVLDYQIENPKLN